VNGSVKNKLIFSITALAVALFLTILLAMTVGAEWLPMGATLCSLFTVSDCELDTRQAAIFWDIRLPRVLLGAGIGGALAVSGASYQSLLRNPLAEPYLLGVSNGAAIGTMIALVIFQDSAWARPLLGFAGAMLATFFVYQIARSRAGMNVERLALAGVIVTTFLSSLIVLVTSLLDATRLRSFTFWLLGDLTSAGKDSLPILTAVVTVGVLILSWQARALNLMQLGERDAFDFGVEVGRTRGLVFVTASALVGSSVAASGSVGYVGLVVPHLVRLTLGSDNRLVLPASALAGAIFVALADTVARTAIAPRELPVGAITALLGAPLFIYLLRKQI
jgi:iron complex transport system permease protein